MAWYHINRRMLVYKAWYFFSISAMTLTPFMSLHLKQFGMSPSRIGLLTFMRNVCVAIFTPIVGLLSDIFRSPKLLVIIGGIVWIGSVLMIGFFTPRPQQKSCQLVIENLEYEYDQCFGNVNSSATMLSFRHFDQYGVEESMECEDLNDTLASDRTWLYTPDSLEVVFYMFLIAFCLVETSFQYLHSVADAESVNTLEDMGIDIADYGNQRAFGSLGWAIT